MIGVHGWTLITHLYGLYGTGLLCIGQTGDPVALLAVV